MDGEVEGVLNCLSKQSSKISYKDKADRDPNQGVEHEEDLATNRDREHVPVSCGSQVDVWGNVTEIILRGKYFRILWVRRCCVG